jgi:hypothetical protein
MTLENKLEEVEQTLISETGVLSLAKLEYKLNDACTKWEYKVTGNFENTFALWEDFLFSLGGRGKGLVSDFGTLFASGEIQCTPSKYRSIDELFLIVKNYFPEVKLIDIYRAVIQDDNKSVGERHVRYFYCPNIKKRVTCIADSAYHTVAEVYFENRVYKVHNNITDEELKQLL